VTFVELSGGVSLDGTLGGKKGDRRRLVGRGGRGDVRNVAQRNASAAAGDNTGRRHHPEEGLCVTVEG
jgi:hypothetical protein